MEHLTNEEKEFLDRVTSYANEVMPDLDPQKTHVSVQLEKLMPKLKEIAAEENVPVEDIFIKYMDLASKAFVLTNQKMKEDFDGLLD